MYRLFRKPQSKDVAALQAPIPPNINYHYQKEKCYDQGELHDFSCTVGTIFFERRDGNELRVYEKYNTLTYEVDRPHV